MLLAKNYNSAVPPAAELPGTSAAFQPDVVAAFAVAVPEPAAGLLAGGGAAIVVLGGRGRRRRRNHRDRDRG